MADSKHTPGPRAPSTKRVDCRACGGAEYSEVYGGPCPVCRGTGWNDIPRHEPAPCDCGPAFPGNEDIHLTGCPRAAITKARGDK